MLENLNPEVFKLSVSPEDLVRSSVGSHGYDVDGEGVHFGRGHVEGGDVRGSDSHFGIESCIQGSVFIYIRHNPHWSRSSALTSSSFLAMSGPR